MNPGRLTSFVAAIAVGLSVVANANECPGEVGSNSQLGSCLSRPSQPQMQFGRPNAEATSVANSTQPLQLTACAKGALEGAAVEALKKTGDYAADQYGKQAMHVLARLLNTELTIYKFNVPAVNAAMQRFITIDTVAKWSPDAIAGYAVASALTRQQSELNRDSVQWLRNPNRATKAAFDRKAAAVVNVVQRDAPIVVAVMNNTYENLADECRDGTWSRNRGPAFRFFYRAGYNLHDFFQRLTNNLHGIQ